MSYLRYLLCSVVFSFGYIIWLFLICVFLFPSPILFIQETKYEESSRPTEHSEVQRCQWCGGNNTFMMQTNKHTKVCMITFDLAWHCSGLSLPQPACMLWKRLASQSSQRARNLCAATPDALNVQSTMRLPK